MFGILIHQNRKYCKNISKLLVRVILTGNLPHPTPENYCIIYLCKINISNFHLLKIKSLHCNILVCSYEKNTNFLMNSFSSSWYGQLHTTEMSSVLFLNYYDGKNPEISKFPLLWFQQARHGHGTFPIYRIQVLHWFDYDQYLILISGQCSPWRCLSDTFCLTLTSPFSFSSHPGSLIRLGWATSFNKFIMQILCFREAWVTYFFVAPEIQRTSFYL